MTLLSVTELSCSRGEQSLFTELSFCLAKNQCVHIRGANGSGKTSLLRIISGLLQHEQGSLDWHGSAFTYLAHKDGLKNELTAVENLRFYLQLDAKSKLNKAQSEDKLDWALNELGLLSKADSPTKSLSFGQRRRLAFSRLLLLDAQVWILDEPLTGVDKDGRQLIEQHCLNHLNADGAILISHHGDLSHSAFADYCTALDLDQ